MNTITIKDLCLTFDDTKIRFTSELNFEEKKKYLLLGPSGCGKSSLLKVISGQLTSFSGTCSISTNQSKIAYLPQDFHLLESFHVDDNLLLVSSKSNVSRMEKELKIDHIGKRRVRKLSGGERQRVALGQILLQESSVLLLDEPTSALNASLASEIIHTITALDKLVIVVSHDTSLSKFFDEVVDLSEVIEND